jgi:hypothetical protein
MYLSGLNGCRWSFPVLDPSNTRQTNKMDLSAKSSAGIGRYFDGFVPERR